MLTWNEIVTVDAFTGGANARMVLEKYGLRMIKASAVVIDNKLVVVFGRYDDRDHRDQLQEALRGLGLNIADATWCGGEYGTYNKYEHTFDFAMGSDSLGSGFTPEINEAVKQVIAAMPM